MAVYQLHKTENCCIIILVALKLRLNFSFDRSCCVKQHTCLRNTQYYWSCSKNTQAVTTPTVTKQSTFVLFNTTLKLNEFTWIFFILQEIYLTIVRKFLLARDVEILFRKFLLARGVQILFRHLYSFHSNWNAERTCCAHIVMVPISIPNGKVRLWCNRMQRQRTEMENVEGNIWFS